MPDSPESAAPGLVTPESVTPDQLAATRQMVDIELAEYRAKAAKDGRPYFLSKYLDHFYGVFVTGQKNSRDIFYSPGLYDNRNIPYARLSRGRSPLMSSQTPREFYEVVDRAAETESLDIQGIKDLLKEASELDHLEDEAGYFKKMEEVGELVLPAYIRLRALGYQHYPDLT